MFVGVDKIVERRAYHGVWFGLGLVAAASLASWACNLEQHAWDHWEIALLSVEMLGYH